MDATILVTGATGTTGSEVVKQLTASGVSTRALVRNRDKARSIEGPGVELAIGDYERPDTLDAALEGIERVYLVSSPDLRQAELQGNLVDAAKRARVKHISKLSALTCAADSPVGLIRQHWQTERKIEESGIAFTYLRPHYFMQNTLMFAPSIQAEGNIYIPMRDGKISLVDVRDVAAVAVAVLTGTGHEGKAYDVTGPEALSFAEIADTLGTTIGKKVTYVDVPPKAAVQGMTDMGVPDFLANDLVTLMGVFAAGKASQVSSAVADVAKKEPIPFSGFARDFAGVFRGEQA